MGDQQPSQAQNEAHLEDELAQAVEHTRDVATAIQRASDELAVVHSVLEQELPAATQVGEVAQAVAHTNHLEKKLASQVERLEQVEATLERELDRRATVDGSSATLDGHDTPPLTARPVVPPPFGNPSAS